MPTAEGHKTNVYKPRYGRHDFIPMVGDSFGRIADDSLLFLWKVASVVGARASHNLVHVSDSSSVIFHSLRTKFLANCFEATARRMIFGLSPLLLQSFSSGSVLSGHPSDVSNLVSPLHVAVSSDRGAEVESHFFPSSSPSLT